VKLFLWTHFVLMNLQNFYAVTEKSQIGEARRRIGEVVKQADFDDIAIERVAIVVTELATNLLKHAGEGELVVRILERGHTPGIEILALDRGPGMVNVAACLRDTYSTTGSLGQGLGAIQRLSNLFDLYSAPGVGTALLVHLWTRARTGPPMATPFAYGAVSRPKSGEQICGDGWSIHVHATGCTLLVCDGLGHGPEAAAATRQAIQTFWAEPTASPITQVEQIHLALRNTRGAALAVVALNTGNSVDFVGVGNISGRVLLENEARHLLSQNGIAGHHVRTIRLFPQRWAKDALLILHSDGLGTRWNLNSYPGLQQHHPSVIASVLYRDFMRGSDDVTVVVIKEK
jgi:anti-sigma regulatory factor (Ser/Thr protein kinase)